MSYPNYPMLTDATRARLARCLNYHDGGSPTHTDVQALWGAYTEVEAAWDQAQDDLDCTAMLLTTWKARAEGAERWAKGCQEREQAVEAERDEQRKDAEAWYRQAQVLSSDLAMLEAAARAFIRGNPDYEGELADAVAALDTPPEETK